MRLVECSKFCSQAAIVCLVSNYGNGIRLLSIVVHSAERSIPSYRASVQENARTDRRLQRSEIGVCDHCVYANYGDGGRDDDDDDDDDIVR